MIRIVGERLARLRALMGQAETALLAFEGAEDWRVINVVPVRRRTMQNQAGEWTGLVEVRVRMERT